MIFYSTDSQPQCNDTDKRLFLTFVVKYWIDLSVFHYVNFTFPGNKLGSKEECLQLDIIGSIEYGKYLIFFKKAKKKYSLLVHSPYK